jgi:hypothetical protein
MAFVGCQHLEPWARSAYKWPCGCAGHLATGRPGHAPSSLVCRVPAASGIHEAVNQDPFTFPNITGTLSSPLVGAKRHYLQRCLASELGPALQPAQAYVLPWQPISRRLARAVRETTSAAAVGQYVAQSIRHQKGGTGASPDFTSPAAEETH